MLCDSFREVEVFGEAMQTKKFESCEIPEHVEHDDHVRKGVKVYVSCFLKPYPTKPAVEH